MAISLLLLLGTLAVSVTAQQTPPQSPEALRFVSWVGCELNQMADTHIDLWVGER